MGGPENDNFPLFYVMKMSLRRGWVVLKSLKTPLRNIKMAPNGKIKIHLDIQHLLKLIPFMY